MQYHSGPKKKNPLQPKSIGDAPIVWNSGMGDPSTLGANFTGDASYINGDDGARLSIESSGSLGSLYWDKNFDYKNDLYIKMTIHASHGAGNGGLGWTLFLGSSSNDTAIDNETGSVNIFFDDGFYDNPFSDAISIYVDGDKIGGEGSNFLILEPLDDSVARTVEVLYQHKKPESNFVTIFIDGKYIGKIDIGAWIAGGSYVGVSAISGDGTHSNNHYIKSFEVRSITPWIDVNYPYIKNKKDKIFVLINDAYVDYVVDPAGSSSSEANNILAYLDDNTIAYETFTDISESGWANIISLAGYIIIPELEVGDILPDMSLGAKNKVKNFVSAGGKLLMFAPGNGDLVPFLNDVFSFSLNYDGSADEPINITVDGSALFPSENPTLPELSDTDSLVSSTLPPDSVIIYEGSGSNQSVVTMIPYDSGKIYVLGWDWYDALPLGASDGGWNHLLQSILQS